MCCCWKVGMGRRRQQDEEIATALKWLTKPDAALQGKVVDDDLHLQSFLKNGHSDYLHTVGDAGCSAGTTAQKSASLMMSYVLQRLNVLPARFARISSALPSNVRCMVLSTGPRMSSALQGLQSSPHLLQRSLLFLQTLFFGHRLLLHGLLVHLRCAQLAL